MAKAKDESNLNVVETVSVVSRSSGDEWDWRSLLGESDDRSVMTVEDRRAELEEQLEDAQNRERHFMDLIADEVKRAKSDDRPPVAFHLERWEDKALRYRELQTRIQADLDALS